MGYDKIKIDLDCNLEEIKSSEYDVLVHEHKIESCKHTLLLNFKERFLFVQNMLIEVSGIIITNIERKESKKGWHITLKLSEKIPAKNIVCLQVILGSDYKREMFNLLRVWNLKTEKKFLKAKMDWNVLFDKKYEVEDGTLVLVSSSEQEKI